MTENRKLKLCQKLIFNNNLLNSFHQSREPADKRVFTLHWTADSSWTAAFSKEIKQAMETVETENLAHILDYNYHPNY